MSGIGELSVENSPVCDRLFVQSSKSQALASQETPEDPHIVMHGHNMSSSHIGDKNDKRERKFTTIKTKISYFVQLLKPH